MGFRFKRRIHKFLNCKGIEIIYALILILVFYVTDTYILKKEFNFGHYFELKLATSISATYFIAVLFKVIANKIEMSIEDGLKLTTEYTDLVNQYKNDISRMVSYKKNICDYIMTQLDEISPEYDTYPIIIEFYNDKSKKIIVEDNKEKEHKLPLVAESNFTEIFSVHKHSKVFNSLNIRLDDINHDQENVILKTSRTTYFNSLVTNRAMDHDFGSKLTVRKCFEFGPSISNLKNSLLSNHIGFNGFVITSDNKMAFVKRFNNVSIGKGIIGCSFGASLKSKYALNPDGLMTLETFENAIKCELYDELGLAEQHYDFSLNNNLVCIYRDLVEGGKPQLLLKIYTSLSAQELEEAFNRKATQTKYLNRNFEMDGSKIIFADLSDVYVSLNQISIKSKNKRKKYVTIPAISSSIAMTLESHHKCNFSEKIQ